MKKANIITKIGIFVITALVVLIVSFPYVVNAAVEAKNEEISVVTTENKASKKKERKNRKITSENKAKYENLSDEKKEALKAERKAKREEKKAKFENLTDEEKEALKNEKKAKTTENKKPEKKEKKEKNNDAVNSENA